MDLPVHPSNRSRGFIRSAAYRMSVRAW